MVILLSAAGCVFRGNAEMLESRLRLSEDRNRHIRRELDTSQAELRASRRENEALGKQLIAQDGPNPPSEQTSNVARVESIRFNRLLTGGLDRDGEPGDEVLSVVLEPVDGGGDPVKVPATLDFRLLDLIKPANTQTSMSWSFTAEELATRWGRTTFAGGFSFQLDIPPPEPSAEYIVQATLTLPDGRRFDDTLPITLRAASTDKNAL